MYHKKRKSTHRKHTTRRRRVSGIKDVDFTQIALVIAGGVGARILFNKLTASTNTTMSKLAPYSGVILGVVLPMFVKSPMVKAISLGLVAGGGVNMLVGMKVISGMENPVMGSAMPYRAGLGYPYNAIPMKKVSGVIDGKYVSKPNWSGSGKQQANVISGMGDKHNGSGSGCGSCIG